MLLSDLGALRGMGSVGAVGLLAASLLSIGCEETPPPNPAGATRVTFRDTGAECSLASHESEIGVVGSSGEPELVPNGQQDAEVACTVEAASGGFHVIAELDQAPNLRVSVPVLSTENTEDNPATGSAAYVSTDTGGDLYSSPPETPCEFWIDPDAGQFVRAGEAWFAFSCDAINSEGATCAIGTSYVAVRNCTGAVVEEE